MLTAATKASVIARSRAVKPVLAAETESLVPPLDQHIVAVTVPAAPKLIKITKTATPLYLAKLYGSAARVFWPIHEVKRPGVSKGTWLAAAGVFQKTGIAPATHLEWAFAKAVRGQKPRVSPVEAAYVFDPQFIEDSATAVEKSSGSLRSAQSSILDSAYLRDLHTHTLWLQREAAAAKNMAEVAVLAKTAFPTGWKDEYAFAEKWAAAEQARLEAAAAAGIFIWGST